ncbi:methyltransferase domain-containing protein [Paracoccus sp. 1_MG-2023]|uniref:methyltransferase domain-containing protein n=1 Tax=unclassified Paracoccus (in: a-proteobacteria) TaxID=2688777 RepID=UPI001C09A8F8|nr:MULTISPECIES: methyltransferase domain-containing protein [unclassified Paracoccus (in: a-proteobacteria)]MBU2957036.1 methyltransferase domain-containing protein [Paracoccus sp. C2R09]MDO6668234.1 methyltransferase domain-containing protein [Paracoccus sp. 1_MG-2023]
MKIPDPRTRPTLTDRDALLRQRDRARRRGMVDLFHQIAADEIEDRLIEVNRSFTDIAIVTGFPEIWQARFPAARVVADDALLDLQPGAHDLVIHAMALHWADDPVGQIAQCRRALRPDGLFMGVAFGNQTLQELRGALAQAEAEVTGGLAPRILPMGEIRDLGGLLQRGGLALPVADLLSQRASYRDIAHLCRDLRGMGEGNAMEARLRRPTSRAVFARAGAIMAEHHADRDDPSRVAVTFDLVFLTGWAPAENQQKPLRPGSARTSLADALNQFRKNDE